MAASPPQVGAAVAAEVEASLNDQVWGREPPPAWIVFGLSPVRFIDTPGLALFSSDQRAGSCR